MQKSLLVCCYKMNFVRQTGLKVMQAQVHPNLICFSKKILKNVFLFKKYYICTYIILFLHETTPLFMFKPQ